MRRVQVMVAVATFCIPAAAWAANGYGPQGYSSGGGSSIECDSSGGAEHRCPARGFAGARLIQQLSRAACVEGETWGFDQGDPAVWVSNGCRGQFALIREQGGGGYDSPSDDDGVVECASSNGEMMKCSIPSHWQGVRLVEKLSRSACSPGEDFGYDHRGEMWVDNGCRGRFANDSPY
ncbi:MAG: DUF3011 domain-containing protein [Dokdonella sp.]|uniref:DUF3011 domain-containing protein n=1 Tax=Dokdonella sp. TaxID=2291710 RepID=UPI0025B9CA8C|nr:DUF3011 domain-containing protein [Dokdonella sp.]MBX3700733.1 DUF3011 domain-containing protein [Dokdonella sp.]